MPLSLLSLLPLLSLLLLSLLSLPSSTTSSILTLTDETFEHLTQATTGSTTGSYLLYFHKGSTDGSLVEALESEEATAAESEDGPSLADLGVTLATVDLSSSPSLSSRFPLLAAGGSEGIRGILVYLHQGRFYSFPPLAAGDGQDPSSLAHFAVTALLTSTFSSLPSTPVPPEPSLLSSLLAGVGNTNVDPKVMGGAVGAVLVVVLVLGRGGGGKVKGN